jgi:hypothetical protein
MLTAVSGTAWISAPTLPGDVMVRPKMSGEQNLVVCEGVSIVLFNASRNACAEAAVIDIKNEPSDSVMMSLYI